MSGLKLTLFALLITLPNILTLNVTRSYDEPLRASSIVKIGNHLVTVSVVKKSLKVDWLDSSYEPCHLNFDQVNLTEHLLSTAGAQSLGNGKIVFAAMHYPRSTRIVDSWYIVVVDPKNCSYVGVTRNESGRKIPTVTSIVAYNDSFDVFSNINDTCFPCRYSDKGDKLDLEHSIDKKTIVPFITPHILSQYFEIVSVKRNDPSDGYFYYYMYDKCHTQLGRLDSKFKLITKRYVDYHVLSYSLDYGRTRLCWSDTCSFEEDEERPVSCGEFDEKLNLIETLRTDTIDGTGFWSKIIQNLPDGGAVINLHSDVFDCTRDSVGKVNEVMVQRVGKEPVKILETSCGFIRDRDFVMDDGEFCAAVYNPWRSWVKCVKDF